MPPATSAALVIALLAVLPGAVYVWAFEREAGSFGVSFTDRILRFLGASFVVHFLLGPIEYLLFRLFLFKQSEILFGQFLAIWGWSLVLAGAPFVLGTLIGGLWATRRSRLGYQKVRKYLSEDAERFLVRILVGRLPAPRAWDSIFSERPSIYIRVRTSDEIWLAGRFASDSYAAGFPNAGDLLLEEAWEIDKETLDFKRALDYRIYIPAEKISWLELVEQED